MRRTLLLLSMVGVMLTTCAVSGLAQARIPPDLAIYRHEGPNKVAPGDASVSYSSSIYNKGGSTVTFADGAVVAKEEIVGSANMGSRCYASSGYSCNVVGSDTVEVVSEGENTLGAGERISIDAYAKAPATTGKISATLSADPNAAVTEVSESNNTSKITTYVGQPPATDLSVAQIDSEDPTYVGSDLTYAVKVTNNGEDTAFNAVVEDYLPENAKLFEGAYGGYGGCNHVPEYGALVCALGDIPSGESREVYVFVTTTAAGVISNTATVYADNGDSEPANDTAKEDTMVRKTPADTPPPDTTKPVVSSVTPSPDSITRDRTPTIKAMVRDDQTNLAKNNVKLYVDGRRVTTFSYSPFTDRLSYTTGKLSYGRHTTKIVAEDSAGNTVVKQWTFKVAV